MRTLKYLFATAILFLLGKVIYSSQAPFTIKDQPYINSNFNDIYEKMDTHRHNDPDSAAPQNFIPELDSTYSLGNSLKQWATTYTDAIVFPDGSIQVTAPSGIPGGEVLLTFVDNGSKLAISSLNVLSTQFVRTSAGSSATYTLNQASVTLMGPFAKIRLDNLDSSTAAITSSLNGFSVFKSTAESYIQGFLVFRSTTESKIDALGISTQSIATTLAGFVVFKSTAETKIDALSVFKSTAESRIDALGVSTQTLLSMFSSFSVFRSTAEQKIDGLTTFRSTAEVNIDALSASTTSLNVSISAFSVFKSTAETKIDGFSLFKSTAEQKIDGLSASTTSASSAITDLNVFRSTAQSKIDLLSISTSNLGIQISSTYTWAAAQFNAISASTATLMLQPSNTNYIQNQNSQVQVASFSVISGRTEVFTSTSATFNLVDFSSTIANPSYRAGRVFYDSTEHALSYYNDSPNVTMNIGQEMYIRVNNKSGSTIANGSCVYIDGNQSGYPTIQLGISSDSVKSQVIGVTTEDIANNSIGYVTSFGVVHSLNTNSFSTGTVLFLSTSTLGGFTNTQPTHPNYVVPIGYVTKQASGNGGKILVYIDHTNNDYQSQINALTVSTTSLALQPSNTNYIRNQSQQVNQSSFSVLSGSVTTLYPQRIVWPDGSVQVTSPTAGGGGSGDATVAQINSTYTWAVGQFNAVSLATATLTLHPSNTNYIQNQIASVQQASYSVLLGSISGNLYVGATGFFNAITLDGTYGFGVPDLRINQRGTGIHFDNWYGGASYEPHFDMRIFSAFSQGIKFSSGSMGWQIQDQNSAVKHHWSDQGKVVVNDSNPAAAAVRISSDNVGSLSRHISLANQNNGTGNWANSGSGIFFNNTSADTGENAAIVSRLVRVSPSRATDIMFLNAPGNGPLTYDAAVMTIKSTGTVGIGTVDPKAALHVTSGTVLATNTGNVGIGTINPSQKLDVVGFVKTSGGIIFPDNSAQLTAASTSPWAYSGADIYNVNSGNIGVGNSNTNPQSLFEIEGTFLSTANPSFHAIGRYSQFSSYSSTSSVSISTMIPNLYAITDFGQNYSIGYGMLVTSGPVYATELCHFTDGTIFTGGTRNVSLFAGNGDFKGTVLLTTNSQTANNWRCAPLPAPVQLNEKTTYYPMSLVGGTTNYVGGVSLRQTNDHFQFTSAVSVLASSPIFTLSNDRGNDNYFGGAFKFVTSTPTITIRDGNVGIGTNNPNKKLHLSVGNVDGIRIQSTNSGNIDFMTTAAGTSNPRNWRIAPQWTVDGNFEILSSSGPGSDVLPSLTRLAIDVSGNVGIGTTSPVQKLQIANGNILLPDANSSTSGNLFFGGNTSTSRTGMRFFGGLINNGAVEGGFIDTVSTSATGGLIIRVDSTSGGTERMRINTSGNVGIGTTSPQQKLDVNGGIRALGAIAATTTGVGPEIEWSGAESNIQSYNRATSAWQPIQVRGSYVALGDPNERVRITGGNVGIGTTAPARKLTVLGDARVGTGTTGCVEDADGTVIAGTCSSDERYKNVVGTMTPILSTFTKLEPEYYYWKFAEYPEQSWGNNMQLGLVAQQVEQHIPDLVFTDENGYKKVKYEQLPMYLLRAIKDLYDEVLELKQRVAILEGGGGQ